jgi:hypothetical protein
MVVSIIHVRSVSCLLKFFCDLGLSIDLMPISTFDKITCLKIKPWEIVVGLVDSSITYPYSVVEDAFFKVCKFFSYRPCGDGYKRR